MDFGSWDFGSWRARRSVRSAAKALESRLVLTRRLLQASSMSPTPQVVQATMTAILQAEASLDRLSDAAV